MSQSRSSGFLVFTFLDRTFLSENREKKKYQSISLYLKSILELELYLGSGIYTIKNKVKAWKIEAK